MQTSTVWTIRLVVMLLLAIGGYQKAAHYERDHGHTPWQLPRPMWSLFWALGLAPGAILWVIATRTDKTSQTRPPNSGPPAGTFAQQGDANPRFGGAEPRFGGADPRFGAPTQQTAVLPQAGPPSPDGARFAGSLAPPPTRDPGHDSGS